uniref:Ovule protein n=1 Tax=Nippostrongylus brasiliensis TaxID=27835 RepID=A0A0N4YID2_NIPBR
LEHRVSRAPQVHKVHQVKLDSQVHPAKVELSERTDPRENQEDQAPMPSTVHVRHDRIYSPICCDFFWCFSWMGHESCSNKYFHQEL